jgi:hypothetical protein
MSNEQPLPTDLERRPELATALARARKAKCSAKLDPLSRDVHFISGLMAHRVPFIVALDERKPWRPPKMLCKD